MVRVIWVCLDLAHCTLCVYMFLYRDFVQEDTLHNIDRSRAVATTCSVHAPVRSILA
jgi:hypothetical protein